MYQYYEELFSTHTQQIETMIAKRTHNKITRSTRRLKPSGPSAAYENVDAAHDLLKRYAARVVAPHRSKELRAAMSMAKATLEVIRAQEQADIPKEAVPPSSAVAAAEGQSDAAVDETAEGGGTPRFVFPEGSDDGDNDPNDSTSTTGLRSSSADNSTAESAANREVDTRGSSRGSQRPASSTKQGDGGKDETDKDKKPRTAKKGGRNRRRSLVSAFQNAAKTAGKAATIASGSRKSTSSSGGKDPTVGSPPASAKRPETHQRTDSHGRKLPAPVPVTADDSYFGSSSSDRSAEYDNAVSLIKELQKELDRLHSTNQQLKVKLHQTERDNQHALERVRTSLDNRRLKELKEVRRRHPRSHHCTFIALPCAISCGKRYSMN